MPVREAADRRGRAQRGRSGLLERQLVLGAIDDMLDAASRGAGAALLIEGHAGMGKTRLHESGLDGARDRGMRVLRAAGAELERTVAFGVAGQLLGAELSELAPPARATLLASAADPVRALAGTGTLAPEHPIAGEPSISHGLFAMLFAGDEARPTLVAIDDLHWSDSPSLEFLLYVLHRLDELPIGLLLTQRAAPRNDAYSGPSGRSRPHSAALNAIAAHPRVTIEALSPLRTEAVGRLVHAELGGPCDEALIQACQDATAGNPFYLHELLLALREEKLMSPEELAPRARALVPDAVTRNVRVRVGRLGAAAGKLSHAVALLGDDAPLRQAAHLAGLNLAEAAAAVQALARVEILLDREPLRFVHPLVAHAVNQDMPTSERASRHLDAARLLYAEGSGAERVAAHLLLGRSEGDGWVVEQLIAAARDARARGAPQSAASYLRRALDEPPAPARRAEVLAELGIAEVIAGLPSADEHLARAAAMTEDPRRRAELALERGRALDGRGLHADAAASFQAGLRTLGSAQLDGWAGADPQHGKPGADPRDRELHDQLEAGFVAAATLVPALHARVLERSGSVLDQTGAAPQTQGERLLLALAARRAAFAGRPAATVLELAERAWDDGCVLEQAASQWIGWRLTAEAFLLGGDLERALEVAEAAIEDARRRTWPLAFATASFFRAVPEAARGRIDAAVADLESARDARRYGWRQFSRMTAAQYALCLVEKGELDRAAAVLEEEALPLRLRDLEDAICTYALGTVRLAQSRREEALELALSSGRVAERTLTVFGFCPWRTAAAEAALALGDRERALSLAAEAMAVAERTGVLHQRIRALRVLGLCREGEAGLETLRAAVDLGREAPPRLETIRALIDLGAAMRRANQRAAAREPLQVAVDLALHGGATALGARARTELAATGARPRRLALLRGPASLTPSERRIAELAAGGQGNREIAQALFVTPKTVEYHLRNAYRKLGIEKRRELAEALQP